MLVSVTVTFILYDIYAKNDDFTLSLQNQLERLETERTYYNLLDKQNEDLRSFIHDEKNHLHMIKSLAQSSKVTEYIDSIYPGLDKITPCSFTNNKMMDLIISKYSVLCKKEGVKFYYSIKTANLDFMEDSDLISLMSNILDNALEAAKSSEKKTVDLSINKSGSFDMLICVNSSDSAPLAVGKRLKTTKDNKRLHGVGTKKIESIARKYLGNYDWVYDRAEKEFTTYVMFNERKN